MFGVPWCQTTVRNVGRRLRPGVHVEHAAVAQHHVELIDRAVALRRRGHSSHCVTNVGLACMCTASYPAGPVENLCGVSAGTTRICPANAWK